MTHQGGYIMLNKGMKIGRVEIAPNGAIEQRWKRDARSLKYVLESWEPGALRFAMAFALMDMDKEYSKQIQGAVNDYKKNLKQKEN